MISQILATLVAAIIAVISQTGYIGAAVLIALESACIPLPSEVILPFAGYLASTGRFSLAGVATAGASTRPSLAVLTAERVIVGPDLCDGRRVHLLIPGNTFHM